LHLNRIDVNSPTPFLPALRFGEGFNPNESPEYWLVEMSGLPYGIPAEQLTFPNLWRGMVFAEGARPAPYLWQAWDSMGLTTPGTTLTGWWDDMPLATVSLPATVRGSVYTIPSGFGRRVTSYVLAIASWHPVNVTVAVTLHAAIGNVAASAPGITSFQEAVANIDLRALPLAAGKGWLVSLKPKA